jgi:cytochrome oxidase Cu insertion factor (SCO1/SenC/PrrC family)
MMRNILAAPVLLALAAVAGFAQQPAASPSPAATPAARPQAPPAPKTTLKVGDMAPDFTLPDTKGQPVHLADFRGKKNVILAFYVLAFTGG